MKIKVCCWCGWGVEIEEDYTEDWICPYCGYIELVRKR